MLVDYKCALEIVDLYKVHLSVDIYIQHPLSQPEYNDGPFDDIEVDHEDIVDESGEMFTTMYEEVIGGKLKGGEFKKTEMKESEANEVELKEVEENNDNMHEGGEVYANVSFDDTKDVSFNYDSALEITFDDESDEYDDFEEGELVNLID